MRPYVFLELFHEGEGEMVRELGDIVEEGGDHVVFDSQL